jgi:hypothetical protein
VDLILLRVVQPVHVNLPLLRVIQDGKVCLLLLAELGLLRLT